MTALTRILAAVKDGVVDVRVLMLREMGSGRRRFASGKSISVWFIAKFKAPHNDKAALEGAFSASIFNIPYFVFRFRGGAHRALLGGQLRRLAFRRGEDTLMDRC